LKKSITWGKRMTDKEKIMAFLIETMTEGKEFVIEKAPETVQQLVAYNIASNTLYLCLTVALWLAAFTFAGCFGYKLFKYGIGPPHIHDDCRYLLGTGISAILIGVLTLIGFGLVDTLMLLNFAPNVFVLEWLGVVG
jgi:hypothetical protein